MKRGLRILRRSRQKGRIHRGSNTGSGSLPSGERLESDEEGRLLRLGSRKMLDCQGPCVRAHAWGFDSSTKAQSHEGLVQVFLRAIVASCESAFSGCGRVGLIPAWLWAGLPPADPGFRCSACIRRERIGCPAPRRRLLVLGRAFGFRLIRAGCRSLGGWSGLCRVFSSSRASRTASPRLARVCRCRCGGSAARRVAGEGTRAREGSDTRTPCWHSRFRNCLRGRAR